MNTWAGKNEKMHKCLKRNGNTMGILWTVLPKRKRGMDGRKVEVHIRVLISAGSRVVENRRLLNVSVQYIRDLRRTRGWRMNGIIIFQVKCWAQRNCFIMQGLTWSMETMHWRLDVLFDEDRCRVQSKNIQQNLNMLRKTALNLDTDSRV